MSYYQRMPGEQLLQLLNIRENPICPENSFEWHHGKRTSAFLMYNLVRKKIEFSFETADNIVSLVENWKRGTSVAWCLDPYQLNNICVHIVFVLSHSHYAVYCTRDEHAYHYDTDVVQLYWYIKFIVIFIYKHIAVFILFCSVWRGFWPRLGQTKDYKIGICCFSVKHATLRRNSK
jgi:hypothetical protein